MGIKEISRICTLIFVCILCPQSSYRRLSIHSDGYRWCFFHVDMRAYAKSGMLCVSVLSFITAISVGRFRQKNEGPERNSYYPILYNPPFLRHLEPLSSLPHFFFDRYVQTDRKVLFARADWFGIGKMDYLPLFNEGGKGKICIATTTVNNE